MELLLLSSSRIADGGFLVWAHQPIREIVGARRRVAFVPFAGVTIGWNDFADIVRHALAPLELEITGVSAGNAVQTVRQAEVIMVGGGNTFALLKGCRECDLLRAITERVRAGTPYIGWSAGANLACPTICTTNDMPIVDPGGFDALGLIPVQINPHYTNALPPGHQGETRDQRIAEFLCANPQARVIGMPEGTWLRVSRTAATLGGTAPAFDFSASAPKQTILVGEAVWGGGDDPRAAFLR